MIIFDLDGTLADSAHRMPMIAALPRDGSSAWDQCNELCQHDTPIVPVITVLRSLHPYRSLQIWTGRNETARRHTVDWITRHVFFDDKSWLNQSSKWHVPLRMRPTGCLTSDPELKEQWLEETHMAGMKVEMVFEDRKKVCAMWRRRGIICAQVADGDF